MNHPNPLPSRWPAVLMLALLMTFMPGPAAQAANSNPPGKMTFQGFLTDAGSPPVPLGNTAPVNKEVTFKIYDNATEGAVKWAETQIVTLDKGHFSVLLGEGSSVSGQPHASDLSGVFIGPDASDRWLGITVDGAEITPRIQFFAAPYAQLAKAANSLVNPTGQTILNLANGKLEGSTELTLNPGPLTVVGNATVSGTMGIGNTTPASALDIGPGSNWRPLTVRGTGGTDAVVIGNNAGKATIAGHTGALNQWADLVLNPSIGNVGIGTSSPEYKLDVSGIARFGTPGQQITFETQTGFTRVAFNQLRFWDWDGGGDMVTFSNGKVGINKNDPKAPLHVELADLLASPLSHYLDGFGVANWGGGNHSGLWLSAIFSHGVRAGGFYVNSDGRIKQITNRPSRQHSLDAIRQLQVTDYTFVDKLRQSAREQRGLIAQEVEKVMPEAVTKGSDFIPDIYALAADVQFNSASQTLTIELKADHGLKADDLVSLITDDGKKEAEVRSVPTTKSFVIKAEKDLGRVFVFGKKVNDFRTVNYDRIFTTGISALQELDHQVQALKKSEARIAELEQKTARLAALEEKAARVDSMERELTELKNLVASLAKSKTVQQQNQKLATAVER